MAFIPFMLCERLTDPARLQDRRYLAEPSSTASERSSTSARATWSLADRRCDLDLLRHAGMAWLRELTWPVVSAVLDGEAVAGDGHEGIQAVFAERDKQERGWRSIARGRRVRRDVVDVRPVDQCEIGSSSNSTASTRYGSRARPSGARV